MSEALGLYLAGGKCPDFYPMELNLSEGIGRLFCADLRVATDTRHSAADLASLLDKGASVTVTQKLGDNKTTRSRFLHGIVTAAGSSGSSAGVSEGKPCFFYTLRLEPEVSRLRHSLHSRSFDRKTAPDIVTEILALYTLSVDFSFVKSQFGTMARFGQGGGSDLEFVQSLLRQYGLSFVSGHPAVGTGALAQGKLYVTDGDTIPEPVLRYSDRRNSTGKAKFDFLNNDDANNVWRMEEWGMGETVSPTGLRVLAAYPYKDFGSKEWQRGDVDKGQGFWDYGQLFHSYEREATPNDVDADMKLLLDALWCEMRLSKRWMRGRASNIALMTGLLFDLAHYNGPKDNAVITALVTAAKLRVRAAWPQHLAAPQPHWEEEIDVAVECMDWGAASPIKRFCQHKTPEGGLV